MSKRLNIPNTSYNKHTPKAKNESYIVNMAEVLHADINPNLQKIQNSAYEWVNYGINNNYPAFLAESVHKSTLHSGFIALRQNMIRGGGLSYSDNIKEFLQNLDEDGTTINDITEYTADDLAVQEAFAFFVRYDKTKTKIIHVDFCDSAKVRPSKYFNEAGKVQYYMVCADWSNPTMNTPIKFEKFNTKKITETTQLLYYKKGNNLFPDVSYKSCLNHVEQQYQTSKYGLNVMLNGFFASAILSVKASMSDEQKRSFKNSVSNTFTGSDNASKLMVNVSEGDDTIKITPISAGDNTNMLKALEDMADKAIISAHRCNPALAGAQTGTPLSSDGKLIKMAQELYYNNVIVHFQKPILAFWKKVLDFNGYTDYTLNFDTLNLVSEDVPDWFLQDYVKPEALAKKYGYKIDDLHDSLKTPVTEPIEPTEEVKPVDTPYES